ncbi:hypothetical protein SEA_FORZA_131 [Gordonia phage Forza]|uniref:VWFA domain-containing protein n=1 Tax=Gordonia phage Forza TaxID=2571247 RepID=A0A650EYJ4_9CAUD|nr:hypothetical protein PP303_gp131 [Gordonia phage Forza]QEM41598.1 hypothetical protein SEA_BOOPY_131 [Gordonia phage Boopy]QGT55124.1 hypothetical protein SEA_FORZA_131 [Gordonia phage Forza]UXE04272.1 hypothetical protein SEA_BLUENGOLD_130 [Gordonia phage BlueNGold]WBF03912.1 hypothetical protein SEA_MAREELIH_129 [Gordonia phage Mareelih]
MNENLTHIAILIDRSGSMGFIKDATERGLQEFLEEQKNIPGEVKVTLAEFNTKYNEVYHNVSLDAAKDYQIRPSGMTALYDGIGKIVSDKGAELRDMDEKSRPGKVIVLILTDGEENSSREWKQSQVKELLKQQQDVYSWTVVFLGANIDAERVGTGIGITRGSSLTYGANASDVKTAFAAASSYVGDTRTGLDAVFTDAQRSAAVENDK